MSKVSDFKFRFFCVLLAFFLIVSFAGMNSASLTAQAVVDQPMSWADPQQPVKWSLLG